MLKGYKYRIYPTKYQEVLIGKHIGCCRFIYNWALAKKIKSYQETGKSISQFDLNKEITVLKKENEWLNEVNSQSLQGMTRNLESGFTRFFREKKGFPNFKSKKNPLQSFPIPQHYIVNFEDKTIKIPKIGVVKTIFHRQFKGMLKTATLSKSSTEKYFISILVDDGKEIPEKELFSEATTMGIDVGIKNFVVLSDGTVISNPKYLKNSIIKIKILQRRLSKKEKGSKNRNKAIKQLSIAYEKIANQRNDFQHKLSHKLISENQALALETLNVSGMMKNHCLAQAIGDASWSSFVEKLTYKGEWYGKSVLRIGRFKPSSKLCNICGYHNASLILADREWTCPECNTLHNRDNNAAINIKKFALMDQNMIGLTPVGRREELVNL